MGRAPRGHSPRPCWRIRHSRTRLEGRIQGRFLQVLNRGAKVVLGGTLDRSPDREADRIGNSPFSHVVVLGQLAKPDMESPEQGAHGGDFAGRPQEADLRPALFAAWAPQATLVSSRCLRLRADVDGEEQGRGGQ